LARYERNNSKCEVCGINNRKKLGGSDYVTTVRKLEKVAIDLIDIREEGKYVLVAIDYYSRGIWTRVIDTKDAGNVVDVLSNWFRGRIKPEEIISDNGKEFANMKFKTFCKKRRIRHRMVSVESHRSNGRVERVIGTLREGLVKIKGNTLEERVEEITRAYNNTYHSGIRCTPREAWKDETNIAMIENNREGKYIKQFKKTKREKFKIGDRIRIAKKENVKEGKHMRGRFLGLGDVIGICGGDSYLIKDSEGKLKKKRHCDLKKVLVDERS
jgi:phosphoribosylformylglycinamidine (FGAM) synthase-like enzyme